MPRRCWRTSACLAILALLVHTLTAFVPAKAAQRTDEILGPVSVCTAAGTDGLGQDGDSQRPAPSHSGKCPSCTLVKLDALEKPQKHAAFAGVVPPPQQPPVSWWVHTPTRGHTPSLAKWPLGTNRSRDPPAAA